MNTIASVDGLTIEIEASGIDVVREVGFRLAPGEILGLVGETASGKTTAATSLLGYQRRGAHVTEGTIDVGGISVRTAGARDLRRMRGGTVAYVPQDPGSALNPALRLGTQLREILDEHEWGHPSDRPARIIELLKDVSLPNEREFLDRYPHQISGGQQQRLLLAMAFACRPAVIVLDEPTTGLDVTTQAHILGTIKDLTTIHGTAALYVTHDLSVIANIADRIAVMYGGRIVESGSREQIFTSAQHPYTRKLLAASPTITGSGPIVGIRGTAPRPGARPAGCVFADRCDIAIDPCGVQMPDELLCAPEHSVRCWRPGEASAAAATVSRRSSRSAPGWQRLTDATLSIAGLRVRYGSTEVLHGIDLTIGPGECLALVGESGSGKTTLARTIAGIHSSNIDGTMHLGEREIAQAARRRSLEERKAVQYIFQNPYSALHPRKRVRDILEQPLRALFTLSRSESYERVQEVAALVRLDASALNSYPDQLSGGERQRVAIARGLAAQPALLICDEVTSALDVSVQASIIQLLVDLKRSIGLGLIFVTHNLALVRSIADRVAVLRGGEIVEQGDADDVLLRPSSPYTVRLLADTPVVPDDLVRKRTW